MQSLQGASLVLAAMEETHAHLLCLVAAVGPLGVMLHPIVISHVIPPPPLLMVYLAFACRRMETQQISGKIHPQDFAQISQQLSQVMESRKHLSVPPVSPAAVQGGGRATLCLSASPADAGML